ncbi:MAG TPA: hypothetical protein DHW82_10685 [Spirochaetia bacterium]|nr:MAG: hypothetical protein A2Y41_10955 [Spirochaetes bacterium GWB1_36_13]HCL57459.1 hypothetical protein [Spirochaetia bacterium]
MLENFTRRQKINYFLILFGAGFHFLVLAYFWHLPRFVLSIGGNESDFGLILGMTAFPIFLFSPVSGYLSDRISPKILILSGIFLAAGSSFAFLLIERISIWIYILRILQGLGHAFVFAPALGLLSKMIPEKNKAEGLGYFAVAIQSANTVGSLLASRMLDKGVFVFFTTAALSGAVSWILMSFVKIEKEEKKAEIHRDEKKSWLNTVLQKKFLSGYILILFLGGMFGTVLQFLPAFFDSLYQKNEISNPLHSSFFLTTAMALIALSRVFLGKMTDRVDKVKITRINFVFLSISVFLISLIYNPLSAVGIALFFGASYGLLYPVLNALVLMRSDIKDRGKVSGVLTMLFDTGFSAFAFLNGMLVFHYGYKLMFSALAGLMVLGFFIFTFLERKKA